MMNCCGVFGARRGCSLCMSRGQDAGNRQSEADSTEQGMKHRLDGQPIVTTKCQVRKAGPLANRVQRLNLEAGLGSSSLDTRLGADGCQHRRSAATEKVRHPPAGAFNRRTMIELAGGINNTLASPRYQHILEPRSNLKVDPCISA